MLAVCHHKTAKVQWDALINKFGHPGNLNDTTPEGVAHPELDLMPRKDANSNTDTHAHPDGAESELMMDRKEDHLLEVEEKGIARKNASIKQDIGPHVKLQGPGVSPLATQENIRSLTPPSLPSSPITPEAASM